MQKERPVRLGSVDALRGVAAMVVVIHHFIQFLPQTANSDFLHRLFPGSAAVLIFFVLSGLVLAMTFVYRDGDRYTPFLVKRIFRIWAPFAIVICGSATLLMLIGHHPVAGTTPTFAANWATPVTGTTLVNHLAMLGTDIDLDGPMWSLIHEMRISLIFPLLIAAVLWNWRVTLLATTIAALATGAIHAQAPLIGSLLGSVRFLVLFAFGAAIALHLQPLRHVLGGLSRPVRSGLWLFFLFVTAMSADYSPLTATLTGNARFLVHGLASAGVVLMCVSGTASAQWLTTRIPVYLGRISYSLYLAHVVVMTAVIQLLRDTLPVPASALLGMILAIVVADVLERSVERPMTRIGRDLARALNRRDPQDRPPEPTSTIASA